MLVTRRRGAGWDQSADAYTKDDRPNPVAMAAAQMPVPSSVHILSHPISAGRQDGGKQHQHRPDPGHARPSINTAPNQSSRVDRHNTYLGAETPHPHGRGGPQRGGSGRGEGGEHCWPAGDRGGGLLGRPAEGRLHQVTERHGAALWDVCGWVGEWVGRGKGMGAHDTTGGKGKGAGASVRRPRASTPLCFFARWSRPRAAPFNRGIGRGVSQPQAMPRF